MQTDTVHAMLLRAKSASRALLSADTALRDRALDSIGAAIEKHAARVLEANARDLARAKETGLSGAMLDRLALDEKRLGGVVRSVREVRALPDPLGAEVELGARPNGMRVSRKRIPLGVLAVIYEARPNVTVEAATLALKSGNAMVLRGGKEALESNLALVAAVREGVAEAGLPADAVQLVADTSRERVAELLGAVGLVDLVIPRGGAELMKMVDAHARVPVIRHGLGICHMYVDEGADAAMAEALAFNAKVQRPGVCNALETLLVHRAQVENGTLARVAKRLVEQGGVEVRADERARAVLEGAGLRCVAAVEQDWDTEFLSLTLAVRVVDSLDEALAHIDAHGTKHTASILTQDPARAERFLREVDASCVLWNASTRFNDGGELGLGAEIGVSTTKMHAYGPMGLRELTAEKFVVRGDGQARA